MKRYYFIGDDLDVVALVERELQTNGIPAEQIHVLSLDDADAELHHVHDVQSLMKKDVIHSAEIGALIGVVASIAVIAAAHFSGLAVRVGWVPFVFLAIVLLGFFTWEGGLIGIQTPNARFRRFEKALRAGAHVFFVDVDPPQEPIVKRILSAPSAIATRRHRHVATPLDRWTTAPDTPFYSVGTLGTDQRTGSARQQRLPANLVDFVA